VFFRLADLRLTEKESTVISPDQIANRYILAPLYLRLFRSPGRARGAAAGAGRGATTARRRPPAATATACSGLRPGPGYPAREQGCGVDLLGSRGGSFGESFHETRARFVQNTAHRLNPRYTDRHISPLCLAPYKVLLKLYRSRWGGAWAASATLVSRVYRYLYLVYPHSIKGGS